MTLEELTAFEEIRRLKALYCYHLDYKEWDAYFGLFTRNATLDVDSSVSTRGREPNPMATLRGRDVIYATIAPSLAEVDTVHQVHSPIIELTSPTTAKAIWAMEDIVKMPGFHLEARGHYRETYEIEDGQWRIATLHLTRTYINMKEGDERGPAAAP